MHPTLVDQELARRLAGKYALVSAEHGRTRARLFPASGACVEQVAGGYAVFTEPGCPVSGAKGLGMNGPVTDDEMDFVESFFGTRAVIPDVDLCPFADPSLPRSLGARGYGIVEFDNVRVRPLAGFTPTFSHPSNVQVTIAGSDQIGRWIETVARGFANGDNVADQALRIFTTQYHIPDTTCYLAWVNGEVAGGAMLNLLGDIATLSTTSTLPEYRGLGIHSLLLDARLLAAAKARFELATIMTRPGSPSERNAVRAGFQLAYTAVRMAQKP